MVAGGVSLLDEQVSGSRRDLKHLDVIFGEQGVERKPDEKTGSHSNERPLGEACPLRQLHFGASNASAFR